MITSAVGDATRLEKFMLEINVWEYEIRSVKGKGNNINKYDIGNVNLYGNIDLDGI